MWSEVRAMRTAGMAGAAALAFMVVGCQPGTDDQGSPRAVQLATAQETGPEITVYKSPT